MSVRQSPRPRRRCNIHHLFPRCPGCEAERRPSGSFPQLVVPVGTAEYLLNAARFYETQGSISASEFVTAISVDLREVAA